MSKKKKHLVIFGMNQLKHMLDKGNVWYLENYQTYFDRVTVLYLTGHNLPNILRRGKTVLISTGGEKSFFLVDLIKSPFVLYSLYKRLKPSVLLTADLVFSFWSTLFTFWFQRHFLMPVCLINTIYPDKKPYFLKRKWLEKLCLNLSFVFCKKILLSKRYTELNYFFEKRSLTKHKVHYTTATIEEMPPSSFYESCKKKFSIPKEYLSHSDTQKLLYVGRLGKDKYVEDLIFMMHQLKKQQIRTTLYCIGDGELKEDLINLANTLEVNNSILFLEALPNDKLIPYYQHCDTVVSPLMGTALREAMICGAPIVTYRNAFTNAVINHLENGFLTAANNPQELAKGVIQLTLTPLLKEKFRSNMKSLTKLWDPKNIPLYLQEAFESN